MANVSHEATEAQLEKISQFLTENGQLDERYISTHFLSSCHWMSSYIPSQSLESIQITLAFDLRDPSLSRKRVASSEPALRPTKEPNHESTYWTDLSNQSLISTAPNPQNPTIPSNSIPTGTPSVVAVESSGPEHISTRPGPSGLPRARKLRNQGRHRVVEPASLTATTRIVDYLIRKNRHPIPVTCPTPRLTNSGMAEYGVFPNSNVSDEFIDENGPELEVIRDLEQEEAEQERQLILDSQTRREIQESQKKQDERARAELLKDLELSMEAKDQMDLELEIADQRRIQFGPPNKNQREF